MEFRKNYTIVDLACNLSDILRKTAEDLCPQLTKQELDSIYFDLPTERKHADLTSNIAMRLARFLKKSPMDLGNDIIEILNKYIQENSDLKCSIAGFEIVKPGFLNLRCSDRFLKFVLLESAELGNSYGRLKKTGKSALLEFVSANPTGPLSIAHARQAAVGDSMASILENCGWKVTREYWSNDEGNQIQLLAESVYIRYLELYGKNKDLPEGGYQGEDIKDIAKAFKDKYSDKFIDAFNVEIFSQFAVDWILKHIKSDLKSFGVTFDSWVSQKKLMKTGKVNEVLKEMKNKKLTYKKDSALWFESMKWGDTKDRVLIKQDGSFTYLTPDIAYHLTKYNRGYNLIVDMWGPDHHGYIARIKAAMKALGFDAELLNILIVQLCTIFEGTKKLKISTRSGTLITLKELLEEVGKDSTRFTLLSRRISSHLNFDLNVAKAQNLENPVYYVQYAHARLCSILAKAKEKGIFKNEEDILALSRKLPFRHKEEEINVMRLICSYPQLLQKSAADLEPCYLATFLKEFAAAMHLSYTKHKVITSDHNYTITRLALVLGARNLIKAGLTLLNICAPEKM